MVKASKTYLVLLLIFIFSFIYRLALMFWQGYPPGADIGLHNSVIYSIIGSGPTDFFYNYYHIGGGASLTFPGYHIFTAGVMMITGMTGSMEYVAQALVVALFSSLTVLCAFLITKRVWSTPAAYIVAFLAAISRFDIEMIMWAGYPNVITLMLIPLTFWLYLQKDRFSNLPFLVSTSILAGSMFLTHSLSAGIFVVITVAAILAILLFPKPLGVTRKTALYWFLPIVFGAVLVSPFLVQAVPAYLSDNAYLNGSTGSSVIGAATLSARVLPLAIVLPLFGLIPAFLVFSKQFYKKWVTLPAFLLSIWVFVCIVLTQGYLVKIPFDYNRFLYFLILPLLIFIAVLIEYAADFLARITDTYRTFTQTQVTYRIMHLRLHRLSMSLTRKKLYSILVLVFLVTSFVALPLLMTPTFTNVGQTIQSFYQTMDNQGWEAMQWAKQNTAGNAVFVADAQYGWWFGGFAQRPTLSAVDPQYLSLNREVDNATFARNLLDTDYLIDNGLVQVRDDGGYIARHNPEILVDQNWTYYPYSFFTFDSQYTQIEYAVNGTTQPTVNVNELAVKDMQLNRYSDHEDIVVTQGNTYLNYTRITTVYGGMRFANLTVALTSTVPGVTFNRIDIAVDTNGVQIPFDDKVSVGLVDIGTKSFGQLIFNTIPDNNAVITQSGIVKRLDLTYLLGDKPQGQVQLSAGAYSASNDPSIYSSQASMNQFFTPILVNNLNINEKPVNSSFVDFDYKAEVLSRSVSYVALLKTREAEDEIQPKFQLDPLFSLVFINGEVAIFKVNGNLH